MTLHVQGEVFFIYIYMVKNEEVVPEPAWGLLAGEVRDSRVLHDSETA